MRRRGLVVGLALAVVCSAAGHAFNLFETAGPVGEHQVALTFGFGLAATELGGAGTWYVVPQGRLAIGLLQGLDLGVQSGWSSEIGTGAVDWLGTLVDVKITSTHVPDMVTFAWGAGGGFGLDFLGNGWGVFLQLLFESHSPYFPVFATYRSILPFDGFGGGGVEFEGYLAGGLRLQLSPIARLLLVVDVYDGLASLGLGLEIAF
jgi:hypothetical protein